MNQSTISNLSNTQLINHSETCAVFRPTYMRYVAHAWKNGLLSTGEFCKFSLRAYDRDFLYETYVTLSPYMFSAISRDTLLDFLKSGNYSLSEISQMNEDAQGQILEEITLSELEEEIS